jgi:molybdopterin molybdotransferase
MISFDEAKKRARHSARILGVETVPSGDSMGRVLAQDVFSDADLPAFDKSAMDGFACRMADTDQVLEVIETIAAGQQPLRQVGPGQCSRIMTGAEVPAGADTVIMIEHTEQVDAQHIRIKRPGSKTNICYRGEDVRRGNRVLMSGTLIDPRHIGVLATAGVTEPLVFRKPRVAVLVTGSELVEPWVQPAPSQIRNSNAYTILSLLKTVGLQGSYAGIVPDDRKLTRKKILDELEKHDVLVMSGAVSMGDFDFIPLILQEMEATILFHGMQVKPGKRMLFATFNEKWIIGLPGNPVSTYIQMHELVLPVLLRMMGHSGEKKPIFLSMGNAFQRKKSGKTEFIPCRINKNGHLEIVEYHGSAHLHALSAADGLIEIPENVGQIPIGATMKFIPLGNQWT